MYITNSPSGTVDLFAVTANVGINVPSPVPSPVSVPSSIGKLSGGVSSIGAKGSIGSGLYGS